MVCGDWWHLVQWNISSIKLSPQFYGWMDQALKVGRCMRQTAVAHDAVRCFTGRPVSQWKNHTVKPILRNHCNERPPVLKDHKDLQCNTNEAVPTQRPSVLGGTHFSNEWAFKTGPIAYNYMYMQGPGMQGLAVHVEYLGCRSRMYMYS